MNKTAGAGSRTSDDAAATRRDWPAFYRPARALPGGVSALAFAELPPLKRALLVIDGTVTTFLEALAGETVVVLPIAQRAALLATADGDLDAAPGTPVIERQVALRGAASDRLYALADSLIIPARLPPALRAALATGALGIGQVLRSPGFESRREGLWFGRAQAALPAGLAGHARGDFLARSYRVLGGGEPVMRIAEFFPWDLGLPL